MARTAKNEEMMAQTPPPMTKNAKNAWLGMIALAVTLRF